MTPYYEDGLVTLYHGDSRDFAFDGLVVSDPPFNIGYGYGSYADRMAESEYLNLMVRWFRSPSVLIHYPEDTFRIAAALQETPQEVVAWVYNANTPRQWRMLSWFGVKPDLSLVSRPYKNPTDSRVRALMEAGKAPGLYDWWHIDQVKNVSMEKEDHPCQMPLEVMQRILLTTPSEVVIDPFAGSGTTLRAAKDIGWKVIGIEMDERYCEVIARRLSQETLGLAV